MHARSQRFTARQLREITTRPGCWNMQAIGVFDGDTQIGEYEYGYHSGCPFYAFEQDTVSYALFSGRNYTKTDVMRLPDCTIVGGEPLVPDGNGFCPVEFYVPAFYRQTDTFTDRSGKLSEITGRIYDDREYDGLHDTDRTWIYERLAFRSGCVWGDDSSWKLELLDLSRVADGIVSAIDIGYIELAPYPLRECLEMLDSGDEGIQGLRVSTLTHYRLPV